MFEINQCIIYSLYVQSKSPSVSLEDAPDNFTSGSKGGGGVAIFVGFMISVS